VVVLEKNADETNVEVPALNRFFTAPNPNPVAVGAGIPDDDDELELPTGPANGPKRRKKADCMKDSLTIFQSLDTETKATTNVYEMRYGENPDAVLVLNILGDGEHIQKHEDPMMYPVELEFKKDIDFDDPKQCAVIFFGTFYHH
jgi:hypothetical protein